MLRLDVVTNLITIGLFDQLLQGLTAMLNSIFGFILGFVFYLVWMTATTIWTLMDRPIAYVAYVIETLTQALANTIFAPLIGQINSTLGVAVNFAWVIALVVLGCAYMLAAFAQIRIVSPKSVFVWYLVALAFFQAGPSLYSTMDSFRGAVQSAFYDSVLSSVVASTTFYVGSSNASGPASLGLTQLCNNFGPYVVGSSYNTSYISGVDVALAFLRADGYDVMQYLPNGSVSTLCANSNPNWPPVSMSLPRSWYDPGSFFDLTQIPTSQGSPFFQMTIDQQGQIIANATAGIGRLLMGIPLLIFGVIEQIVALLLVIAEGLTFVSFSVALVFAFFKRTEPIAMAVVDMWIGLIVQSVIISLLQSLVVGFLLAGALLANGTVVVAMMVVGIVIEIIIVKSAVKVIFNALDGLTHAFGRVTGGVFGGANTVTGAFGTIVSAAAALPVMPVLAAAGAGVSGAAIGASEESASGLNGIGRFLGASNISYSSASSSAVSLQNTLPDDGLLPGLSGRTLFSQSLLDAVPGHRGQDVFASDSDAARVQPELEEGYLEAEIVAEQVSVTALPVRGKFRSNKPLLALGSGDAEENMNEGPMSPGPYAPDGMLKNGCHGAGAAFVNAQPEIGVVV